MNSIRFAIVGCGKIAEQHVRSLQILRPMARIVALCDIDGSRLKQFAVKLGLAHLRDDDYYTDADALLRREDIDCAVVTTTSHFHAPIAIKALRAGKHVLVEKPMALTMRDARQMVELAESRGLVLAVSLQTRYLTQVRAIKEAVEAGDFGRLAHGVVSVRWNRSREYYAASPWRGTREMDGGIFLNQCIHYIDLLQWMLGPLESIYGQADTFVHSIETEDAGVAVMKFKNGSLGIIEGSTCVYPENLQTSLSLFGERGSVSLEGERLNHFRYWRFKNKRRQNALPAIESISYIPLYQDMIGAIKNHTVPLVSGRSALDSLETVLALYQSIRKGSPATLPIDDSRALGP